MILKSMYEKRLVFEVLLNATINGMYANSEPFIPTPEDCETLNRILDELEEKMTLERRQKKQR